MKGDFRTSSAMVVGVSTTVQVLLTMGTLILPAIAPEAAAALDVPAGWIGLQVSLMYAAATVMSLFSGRLVRRYGAARTTQASLVLLACGSLLAAVPSVASVALGSVFLGLSYGAPAPAAAHVLSRFTPVARRNLLFSLKQTGVPLGGVLAGFVAPPLASAFDWRAPLVLTAISGVLFAAFFVVLAPRWDDDRDPSFPLAGAVLASFRLLLGDRVICYLAGVGLLLAAVQLCLVSFLVVLLVEDYGFTIITAGIALALVQVGGVLGRVTWGFTADVLRDGLLTLLVVALISASLAFTLTTLPQTTPPWIVVALLVGMGATAIGWNGVFLAETARVAPSGRVSESTGALLSMSYLGIFIGPSSFTALAPMLGGYRAGFVLLAAVSAAAGVLLVAARWRRVGRSA